MRSINERTKSVDVPEHRDLLLLSEVEENPEVTQRQLSLRLGIALGLTNVLLKSLVHKGYVRATHAGWKRWLYNLTPEGVSHKLRLTVAHVRRTLNNYSQVRQTLREQLEPLSLHRESRVAICGTGDFAELVFLGLKENGIDDIEVFGLSADGSGNFLGMPVHDLTTLDPKQYDRVLETALGNNETISKILQEQGTSPDQLVAFFVDDAMEGRI